MRHFNGHVCVYLRVGFKEFGAYHMRGFFPIFVM
jgi:hypothetical protein